MTCRFIVGSASEAALVIREKLGPEARVLSIRTIPRAGLAGLWRSPRIEVLAQSGEEAPAPSPAAAADEFPSAPAGIGDRPAAGRPVPSLISLLRRSGLSEVALARLQVSPAWKEIAAAPLHRALVEIGLRLEADGRRRGPAPFGRVAFLGSAGSGRTTALCKWLGEEVFQRGRKGRVMTVEFDRPNPPGSLPVFCEALGVCWERFPSPSSAPSPAGFLAFDLPCLSLADSNPAIGEFLSRMEISQRVLVINAAYDPAVMRSAYAAGRSLGATHIVFTHLDELPQWGGLWDFLIDGALEPLFLGLGPSLTGECERDVIGALVRRTLAAAPPAESPVERLASFST